MKPLFSLAVLALMMTIAPLEAGQVPHTPEDDIAMTGCIDRARAWLDGEGLPQKSDDPLTAPHALADCIGAASGPCMETPDGMTTIGMSECLGRETDWWDTLLNAHYQTLRATLDTESFDALREAQRAWIAYSERHCQFQYTYWRDGTIRSTFYSSCVLDTTARRAIELEDFLGWSH